MTARAHGATKQIVPYIGGPLHGERGSFCRRYELPVIEPHTDDNHLPIQDRSLSLSWITYVPLSIKVEPGRWTRFDRYMVWEDIPQDQRFKAWEEWVNGRKYEPELE